MLKARKKSRFSWPVAVVAILLLLFFGIMFTRFSQVPSQSVVTSVPSQTAETSIDTNNWQTYTNTRYRFTFKYPQDWIVSSGIPGVEPSITHELHIDPTEKSLDLNIRIYINPQSENGDRNCLDLNDCIKKDRSIYISSQSSKISDQIFLGEPALKIDNSFSNETNVLTIIEGNYYNFYAYSTESRFPQLKKIFDQFLDSIKIAK